jgi:hypothetical protein
MNANTLRRLSQIEGEIGTKADTEIKRVIRIRWISVDGTYEETDGINGPVVAKGIDAETAARHARLLAEGFYDIRPPEIDR